MSTGRKWDGLDFSPDQDGDLEPDKKQLVSPLSGVYTTLCQVMRNADEVLGMSDMDCLEYAQEQQLISGQGCTFNEHSRNENVPEQWDPSFVLSTINLVQNVVPMHDIVTQCHNVGVSQSDVGLKVRDMGDSDLFLFDDITSIENARMPFQPPQYTAPSLNNSPIIDQSQYSSEDLDLHVASVGGTLQGDKYFLSLQNQQHSLVELAPFEFKVREKSEGMHSDIDRKCAETAQPMRLEPSHDDQVYRLQQSNYQRNGGLHAHTKLAVQSGKLNRNIPALALTLMQPKGDRRSASSTGNSIIPAPPSVKQPEELSGQNIMQFASRKQLTYNLEKRQLNLQKSLYSRAERVKVRQCAHALQSLHMSEDSIEDTLEMLNSVSNALPNDLQNMRQWFCNVDNKDRALRQLGLLIGDVFYEKNEQGKFLLNVDCPPGMRVPAMSKKYAAWLQLFGAPMGEEETAISVPLRGSAWPNDGVDDETQVLQQNATRSSPSVLQNGVEDQVASLWTVFLELFDACTGSDKIPSMTSEDRRSQGLLQNDFLSNVHASQILLRPQLGDVAGRYHALFAKQTARFSEFSSAFAAFDATIKSYLEQATKQIQSVGAMEAQYKHQENSFKLQIRSAVTRMHSCLQDLTKYQEESSVLKSLVLININRTKMKMAEYNAVTTKLAKIGLYNKKVTQDTLAVTEMNNTQLKPKLYTYMNNIKQLARTENYLKRTIASQHVQQQRWRLLSQSWQYKQQVHVLGRSNVHSTVLLGKLREKALFGAILQCLSQSNEDVVDASEKLDSQVTVFEEQVQNAQEELEEAQEQVTRAEAQFQVNQELLALSQNEIEHYKQDLVSRSAQVDDIIAERENEERQVAEQEQVRIGVLERISAVTEDLVVAREEEIREVALVNAAIARREEVELELVSLEKAYEDGHQASVALFEERTKLESEQNVIEADVRAKSEEYMDFVREVMVEADVLEKERDVARGRHTVLNGLVQAVANELDALQVEQKQVEAVLLEQQAMTAQKTLQRQEVLRETEELARASLRYESNLVPLTLEERKTKQAEEVNTIQALQVQVKAQTDNQSLWTRGEEELGASQASEKSFLSAMESEVATKLAVLEQTRSSQEDGVRSWDAKKTVVAQQAAASSLLQEKTAAIDRLLAVKRAALHTMLVYLDKWKLEKPQLEQSLKARAVELANTAKLTQQELSELAKVDDVTKHRWFQREGMEQQLQRTDVEVTRHLLASLSAQEEGVGCVGSVRDTVFLPLVLLSVTDDSAELQFGAGDVEGHTTTPSDGLLCCVRNLQCSKECKVAQNYPLGALDSVRILREVSPDNLYPLIPDPGLSPLHSSDAWADCSEEVLAHALFTESVRTLVLECVHIYIWETMVFVQLKQVSGKNLISMMEAQDILDTCMSEFVPQLLEDKVENDPFWQFQAQVGHLWPRIQNTVEQLHVQLYNHIQSINTHSYLLKQYALSQQGRNPAISLYPSNVLKMLVSGTRPLLNMMGDVATILLDTKKLLTISPIPTCFLSQHREGVSSVQAVVDGSFVSESVVVAASANLDISLRVTFIPKYICACNPSNQQSPCGMRLPLDLLACHLAQAFPDDFIVFATRHREVTIRYHDLFEFYWHTMHPLAQAQLLSTHVRDQCTIHQLRTAELRNPDYHKKFYVPPVYDQEDVKPVTYTQTREIGINTTVQQVNFTQMTPVYLLFNFNSEEADAASRHDELNAKKFSNKK